MSVRVTSTNINKRTVLIQPTEI